MGEVTIVGLAEIKYTQAEDDVLLALGVGACIVVCAFDPRTGRAGMAQVVLPESYDEQSLPAKYVDLAIPSLVRGLIGPDNDPGQVRVALIGGAELSAFHGHGIRVEIGRRNVDAARTALEQLKIRSCAEDCGGNAARTVQFAGDGKIRIKVIGKPEQEGINLNLPAMNDRQREYAAV